MKLWWAKEFITVYLWVCKHIYYIMITGGRMRERMTMMVIDITYILDVSPLRDRWCGRDRGHLPATNHTYRPSWRRLLTTTYRLTLTLRSLLIHHLFNQSRCAIEWFVGSVLLKSQLILFKGICRNSHKLKEINHRMREGQTDTHYHSFEVIVFSYWNQIASVKDLF